MRRALFGLVILGAVFAFAQWDDQAEDACVRAGERCRDTRMGRLVAAVTASASWGGGFFSFAMADAGVGGIPRGLTAACACQTVYGVTSDGDAGVLLSLTRNTLGSCTKTQGAAPQSIQNGDMVLCDGGLPVIMYGVGANAPLGLLVEAAATDVCLRSEELENAAWVSFVDGGAAAAVVVADQGTSPSNLLTADRVTFGATTDATQYSALGQRVLTAAAYSGSVYLRGQAGDAGTIDLMIEKTANVPVCAPCNYNSAGWTRCEIQNVTSITSGLFAIGNLAGICDGGVRQAADVLVWGAQAETGVAATSYVPTTSASATRNVTAASFAISGFTSDGGMSWAATVLSSIDNGGSIWGAGPALVQDATNRTQTYRANASQLLCDYISTGGTRTASPTLVPDYTPGAAHRQGCWLSGTAGTQTVAAFFDGRDAGASTAGAVSVFAPTTILPCALGAASTTAPANAVCSNVCVDYGNGCVR